MQVIRNPKIIVILGPTATGKSDLAVQIAQKYKGEVISADSRQVYRDMNIGTGKITKREMLGIPHHLLDVANPQKVFDVDQWRKLTDKSLTDILSRGKVPIICGGTGFYIQSIVENIVLPNVPPNPKLRAKLEKKSVEKLFLILKKLDPKRAKEIDSKNKVRLIRAIEIVSVLGKVPSLHSLSVLRTRLDNMSKGIFDTESKQSNFQFLQIGLKLDEKSLKEKIKIRLEKRIKAGMVKEVKNLHSPQAGRGLSWKRLGTLGLEYRYTALYLQNKITKSEMLEKLQNEIWKYAKRQMTWFKRDQRIKWFESKEKTKIMKEVKAFMLK